MYEHLPADLLGQDPGPLLAWADTVLTERGRPAVGAPTWRRNRHWSDVVRLPTADGPVWAKANAAGFAHEGPLLALIAERTPGTVVEPFAVDAARGWLVLPDGGDTLRDVGSPDPGRSWRQLLVRYADVQRTLIPLVDAALAVGVPDTRGRAVLTALEPAVEAATDPRVHGDHRLGRAEADAARRLVPTLTELSDELSGSPVPAGVEHNDPHPGNVFAASGRLFDFGDAVVGHPFLGLAGALPDAAAALGASTAASQVQGIRTDYLARFADLGLPARLRRDAELAAVLHHLPRAATWLRVVPAGRALFPAALPDRIRSLLRSAAELRPPR